MKTRMVVLRTCLLSLTLVVLALAAGQPTTTGQTASSSESCTIDMKTKRKFGSGKLPGYGWDNLRNLPMKQVIDLTYSMCTSVSNFVVPDEVDVVPVLSSEQLPRVEVFPNAASSKVTSLSSQTINEHSSLSLPFETISGTLSQELREIRNYQYSSASNLIRTQVRLSRYELSLQSGLPLTADFQEAILAIANSIQLNFPVLARHQALTLVQNFGTHVTTKTVLGAVLLKKDYIVQKFYDSFGVGRITKSSSLLYQITTGMQNDPGNDSSIFILPLFAGESHPTKVYKSSVIFSDMDFYGGTQPDKRTVKKFNVWVKSVEANMAVIDRAGDPLSHLIRPEAFPDVPANIISAVSDMVREAIALYYEINTIPGCLDIVQPLYSPFANFPDSSCTSSRFDDTRFGGLYQTCQVISGSGGADLCKEHEIVNSYTSAMSCPKKYTARQLFQGTYSRVDELPCESHASCEPTFNRSEVVYTSYWCQNNIPTVGLPPPPGTKDIGYLFGGFFTSVNDNRMTHGKVCPSKYSPRRLLDDLYICEGNIFAPDLGFSHSPFQGFLSCQNDTIPKFNVNNGFCEPSFSKILATTVKGCNVYICCRMKIEVQPSIRFPVGGLARPALSTYISSYDGKLVFNIRNQTWAKIDKSSFSKEEPKLSYSDTAVIAFLSGFVAIVICVLIFLIICWCWKKSQPPPSNVAASQSQEMKVEKEPSKVTTTKPSMLEFDENQI